MKQFRYCVFVLLSLITSLASAQDNGLSFDGVNDYVSFPSNAAFNPTRTFEAWIYPTTTTGFQTIAEWTDGVDNVLRFYMNNGLLVLLEDDGFNGGTVSGTSTVLANQWNHVAFVETAGGFVFYLDGVADVVGFPTGSAGPTPIFNLGSIRAGFNYFEGIMDEVRVWDAELNQITIQNQRFTPLTGAEANLIAYYQFNESSGTVLPDLTSNNIDGTLLNGVTNTPPADGVTEGPLWVASTALPDPFVTTWQTTDTQITIPTTGGGYNYNIIWTNLTNGGVGDGFTTGQTADYTITGLANGDIYQIEIRSNFPQIYFNNGTQRNKILTVEQWGDIVWSSMQGAFWGCSNLTIPAIDAPDLSNVTDMSLMFVGASTLNSDISGWDVSNVTDMSSMFAGASLFNINIDSWDMSNVTTIDWMFDFAINFNQDLSSWNTSNITSMNGTFSAAEAFNGAIGTWDVSNVTNMESMFLGALAFNQDISTWNVGMVTVMQNMFNGATAFNQNIGGWDVSNVLDMADMFVDAAAFSADLSTWDVSNVTDMKEMFWGASSFNGDISTWNVSGVTVMSRMFQDAALFNQDISSWDVSSVTEIWSMFDAAAAFDQNLGGWDISAINDMFGFFDNSGLSTANYDATLIGWNSLPSLQSGVIFGANGLNYCTSNLERANIISTYSWTINDAGQLCPPPTIQADGLIFSGFIATQVDISWTPGDGTSRIVLIKEATAVDTDPTDNTTYVANTTFGTGDQLGIGNYVVYNGSGNSVTVTGLTLGSTYHVRIYEYNGIPGNEKYLLTTGAANPASFVLGPEIAVFEGATPITNGVTSIDFGSALVGTDITLTFDIDNIGTLPLNISNITIAGDPEFSITSAIPAVVAAGGMDSFDVQLSGAGSGSFGGTITITNDDIDEGTFTIPITGAITTTPEPEISVIYDPVGVNTILADGQVIAVDFGTDALGNDIAQTFAIENIGSAVLNISGITLTGTDFSILSVPATVAIGGTETFTVQLSGASAGTFNDVISIQSDDVDEAVFDFPITGTITGPSESEINLFVGPDNTGASVTDGQAIIIDFGTSVLGSDIDQVFTIENTGTADLNISAITSSNTAFSLQTLLPAPIPPGATDNFTIQLSGASEGTFNAVITIDSDDLDEAIFDFPVSGIIQGPEIAVFAGIDNSGNSITSGQASPLDFGTALAGTDLDQIFTIENQGSSDLVISSISLGTADFNVTTTVPFTVTPGLTSNFTIRLSGQNTGSFNDNVVINSNDSDEPTFGFPITGVIQTPDIVIYDGPDTSSPVVVNGQPDAVDVGQTPQGIDIDKEFVIENTGSSDLNILSIITDQPTVFSIIDPPTTISPGDSASFLIRLNAITPGVYDANATISTDAGDITFPVTGEVLLLAEDPPITVFNAITPNGDGRHEFLRIENIEAYPGNEVTIYSKLGEVVFEVVDYSNSNSELRFEGYSNIKDNNLLPEGTYYYVIKYTTVSGNESKKESGFILLGL